MKTLLTGGLLAAALVLSACSGSSDANPADVNVTDVNGMTDDDEALGLFDPRRDDPDRVLCNRLNQRNPRNWWNLGEFIGQDLVDTCIRVFKATPVGDCLVMDNGSCPGADLRGADLRGAQMREMNLSGANLAGANLSNASMVYTNLSQADLTNTNFSNAQMYGINLRGATIEGANFSGAELRDGFWVDGRKCALSSPRGQCS